MSANAVAGVDGLTKTWMLGALPDAFGQMFQLVPCDHSIDDLQGRFLFFSRELVEGAKLLHEAEVPQLDGAHSRSIA